MLNVPVVAQNSTYQSAPVFGKTQKIVNTVNFRNNQSSSFIDYQQIEQAEKAKKEKRQHNLITAALIIGITTGLTLIANSLGFGGGMSKAVEKAEAAAERAINAAKIATQRCEGGSGGKNDELTGVALNWIDTKLDKNKVANIFTSDTTHKNLREVAKELINTRKLSTAAKKYTGYQEGANIMLLYGYSGTGKTYFAQQYAQEIGALFAGIKYPDIGSPYKDAASMKIANFFKKIIETAEKEPDRQIVVCIDECDAIIKKVLENSHGSEEAAKSRAAVLVGLEEISKNPKCKNVNIIMTTNYHPNNGLIDSTALTRVNKKIEVPLGDADQDTAMLKMYLKGVEAISDDFYKSKEFKKFVTELANEKYSNREIEKIAGNTIDIFSNEVVGIADDKLSTKPFKIEYLQKAKDRIGQPASKTCSSMTADPGVFNL
ncbi:MAG: ATP-binding protein [bacterium]|nr:ATP-binding protein [bacterium]